MCAGAAALLWLTACVLCSPAAGLLCTFEDDTPCVWRWNSTLLRVTGRQAEEMVTSRPAGQMTATLRDADNRRDGHYLLMSSHRNVTQAQIWSPWYEESGEDCRIEMDICSHTLRRTKIAIVINKEHGDPVYMSWHPKHTSGEWNKFTEKISKIRERFHLIIEMKDLGGKTPNHIGIDNILLKDCMRETQPTQQPCDFFQCYNNKCLSADDVCNIKRDCHDGEDESEDQGCGKTPPGTPCDFESGQCGWKRGQGELEWKYRSGHEAAAFGRTPTYDHTVGNASGHFMLAEFISGLFSAHGELVSPAFPPMPAFNSDPHSPYYKSCKFRFSIHMTEEHSGAASVYILDSHNRQEVWRFYGRMKTSEWSQEVVVLPTSFNDSYYLVIGAAKSLSSKASIGIDDLSLSRECFAQGVPDRYRHQYKYNLSNPDTWLPKTPALPEPNGTVFSFGTCGASGRDGPQQRECNAAYKNRTASHVSVLDAPTYKGVQVWRVPATGIYSLVARGASGGQGFDTSSRVSLGSTAVSVVSLTEGEEVYMVVGQEGTGPCNKDSQDNLNRTLERCKPSTHPTDLKVLHPLHGFRSAASGYHRRRGRRWLARRDGSILHNLKSITFVGGGGGGGGGTFVFLVRNSQRVPLVVAAGGGGLSDKKGVMHSPDGRGENHTLGSGNGRFSDSEAAGAGGGWNDSEPVGAGGWPLSLGARGGEPCATAADWSTYGGFGGGGGGCRGGGGGGGYAGGDTIDGVDKSGRGGTSYTSGLYRVVDPASHIGPGEVHIIPAFKGCQCEHLCVAINSQMSSVRCICRDNWTLMDDKRSCQGPPGLPHRQQWSNTSRILFVALAAVFLAVVGSLAGCYYNVYQRKKVMGRRRDLASGGLQLNRLRGSAGDILTEYNPNYEFGGALPCTKDLREIPRQNLTLVKELGKGAFGQVYQGYLKNYVSDSVEMPCAVKTLAELSSEQAEMDFLMEAMIMSKFVHPNIVHFIGVSFERHPRFIVLELLSGGDLKSFLRESRPTPERPPNLKIHDLLTCAIDVAKGCEYLENKRFIHRDIAARNCLLTTKGPGRVVKIADFGMSRDIYRADYYRKGGRTMIPVKWMPPEAFLDGVFTTKTDVWSFGVLLWEVMTLGQLPYPGRGNTEVMQLVMDGGRLDSPSNCPAPVYGVMCQCWQRVPEERPTFATVLERLDYCLQDPDVMAAPLPVFDRVGSTDKDMTVMRPSDSEPLVPLDSHKRRGADTPASSSSADYLVPTQPSSHSLNTVRTDLASEPSWEDVRGSPTERPLVSETSFTTPERSRGSASSGGGAAAGSAMSGSPSGQPLLQQSPDEPPDWPPPASTRHRHRRGSPAERAALLDPLPPAPPPPPPPSSSAAAAPSSDPRRKAKWARKPSPLKLDPGGLPPSSGGATARPPPPYMNVGAEGGLAAVAMPRTSSYDKALGRTEPCIIGISTPKADAEKNPNYSEIHC
ncbi:leukocyte tyrosine kinase receptor-like [Amphibalanus amphitrite]|uniref:leukocyte tyrosine kinase receptor-like n=1 Tax=Amphibalanus amphitrite TaxID=1232801 RepID=UPI001C904C46|nr:leukocyte tyrosine kinase receptor-like [Amphibalanus amphitrite]